MEAEERRDGPVLQVGEARLGLRRFDGNCTFVFTAFPVSEVFPGQIVDLFGGNVSYHDDGAVCWLVKAVEELEGVLVLVGHVNDVLEEAHGGVFVGVGVECGIEGGLVDAGVGTGVVLGVFALDRAGFGFEVVFGVVEVHESVGLKLEHELEHAGVAGHMIEGSVLGGVCVSGGSD